MNLFKEVPVGTVLYGIHEQYGTSAHWIVKEEKVRTHYEWKQKEIITTDGKTPYYYRSKDFGSRVFFNREEAEAEAQKQCEEYDRIWGKYERKKERLGSTGQ